MGDSDDEYSSSTNVKRNRDKFHRERDNDSSAANFNSRHNSDRRGNTEWTHNNDRKDWKSNSSSSSRQAPGTMNPNYPSSAGMPYMRNADHSSGQNRRFPNSYDNSPPHKKNKKDWENGDGHGGRANYDQYTSPMASSQDYDGGHQTPSYKLNQQLKEPDYPTQPACLSFKQFLQQQDDSISDEDAIKKYNDYKIEFKKKQINEFFLAHKEEEWFKSRYHPDEHETRLNEQKKSILKRLEVFMELYNSKQWMDDCAVEVDKSNELIRFLDAAVIKIEGGDEFDLQALDGPSQASGDEIKQEKNEVDENGAKKNGKSTKKKHGNGKKRKLSGDEEESGGSESGAYSDSSSSGDEKAEHDDDDVNDQANPNQQSANKRIPQQLHRTTSIFLRNLPPSTTKADLENLFKAHKGFKRIALSDPAPERGFFRRGWATFDANVNIKDICWSLNNVKVKDFNPGAIVNRDLNKRVRPTTSHICHHKPVVRNDIKIATKIIQNLDKRWNLWNNSVEVNKVVAKIEVEPNENDKIKEEEKDENIGEENGDVKAPVNEPKIPAEPRYVFSADSNPLLDNITDYLVDEMNAEEEELLGLNDGNDGANETQTKSKDIPIDVDPQFNHVLDRLILYLRVVHSFDYYNCIEYQQEDTMPNRCGIIHARAPLPASDSVQGSSLMVKPDEVNAYTDQFEQKIKPYMDYRDRLDDDVAKKLGIKEKTTEVEKFVQTNTVELAADRWLCPISGKKFKGPEFIRKHLFYKHADKIKDVEKEVDYFNNYLMDPKRPQLPEHPLNRPSASTPAASQQQQHQHQHSPNMMQPPSQPLLPSPQPIMQQNPYMMPYGATRMQQMWPNQQLINQMPNQYNRMGGGFNPNMQANYYGSMGRNPIQYGRRMPMPQMGRDQREIIHYKDLDAPDDN